MDKITPVSQFWTEEQDILLQRVHSEMPSLPPDRVSRPPGYMKVLTEKFNARSGREKRSQASLVHRLKLFEWRKSSGQAQQQNMEVNSGRQHSSSVSTAQKIRRSGTHFKQNVCPPPNSRGRFTGNEETTINNFREKEDDLMSTEDLNGNDQHDFALSNGRRSAAPSPEPPVVGPQPGQQNTSTSVLALQPSSILFSSEKKRKTRISPELIAPIAKKLRAIPETHENPVGSLATVETSKRRLLGNRAEPSASRAFERPSYRKHGT